MLNEVCIPNLRNTCVYSPPKKKKANFAIGGATDHPRRPCVYFAGCCLVAINW